MLSFLLDEHISPTVAEQVQLKRPEITIFALLNWQEARYLGLDDEVILKAATEAELTLVTYDQNTIPPVLVKWGEMQISHKGVIFVDYQSIPPSDFGKLVRALIKLWETQGVLDWTNRLIYLQKN